ncbi:MAG: AMP-dependent synthetase [Calditrichaeota bacterium]|nr:MAG: AMP-dependent synthetase [Calditrichota bacterium]
MILLHTYLEESRKRFPDKPALYDGEWYSYKDIDNAANRLARYFVDKGLRRGDRVAVLLHNGFEYVSAYYAVLKAGGVMVGLNTETTPETVAYVLENSGARFLLTDKPFRRYLKNIAETIHALDGLVLLRPMSLFPEADLFEHVQQNYPATPPDVRIISIDLAAIVYTSGSTGKPKGVMLTHLNIVTNTQSIIAYLHLTGDDRMLVVLPFYYIYGLSLLNTHFAVGGSLVIENRFAFPSVVVESMNAHQVTGFAGVPSTFAILMSKTHFKDTEFPALRYVTQAGGAMAPSLQKEVARAVHPARLFIMYGATEASARLSYLDPRFLEEKLGSIGKAIPNVDLYVADEEGRQKPTGETGEIVARGANIMQGYWKDPEETAKVLRHGLYFTGDLGRMDEEGFVYVVGRSKDMIKQGANRISAKEIEEKILEHDLVLEVAVIGVPDEILGEAIDACVTLKEHRENWEEELREFVKTVLPHFKQPRHYTLFESLPKNSSGKIMKTKIREMKGLT